MTDQNEKSYYIVNPAGAIHVVTRDHAREVLKKPGFRIASKAEVDQLQRQGFDQTWKKPICEPWTPEPPDEQDLPEPIVPEKKNVVEAIKDAIKPAPIEEKPKAE